MTTSRSSLPGSASPADGKPDRSRSAMAFVAFAASMGVVWTVPAFPAFGQSAGSPFAPQTTVATIPPSRPAPVASSAYDRAKGAAAKTGNGAGGWLPVTTTPACHGGIGYHYPTTTRGYDPIPMPAPSAGPTTKKSASAKSMPSATVATAASSGGSASAAEFDSRSDSVVVEASPQNSSLAAGSTDDNARFRDYLNFRRTALASGLSVHDLDVGDRHVIRVVDGSDRPVLGAIVDVSDDRGLSMISLRTMADGRVLFFPRLSSNPSSSYYRVTARLGGQSVEQTIDRSRASLQLRLPEGRSSSNSVPKIDVQFLIDTTGSMSDEIDRLRSNMVTVSERIASLPSRPDVRFGMTVYRDCGDEFVSRTYDFDKDVSRFRRELNTVVAGGGGDTPEHLNQALHDAISRPGWRGDDTVKLVFLIADAEPHLDYPGDYDYSIETLIAARRGIKIHPIASSGLNPTGEFIFRQVALHTMGKFLFLTYGADGKSPGDRRVDLNVDAYETLALDQLVVRLVSEELSWQEAVSPGSNGQGTGASRKLPNLPSGPANMEPPTTPGRQR